VDFSSATIAAQIIAWFKGLLPMIKRFVSYINGPAIGIKLLSPVNEIYNLEIRNIRGGVAIARVFLCDLTGADEQFTGRIVSPIEICQGNTIEWPRLFGQSRALFPILMVDRHNAKGPSLLHKAVGIFSHGGGCSKHPSSSTLIPPSPIQEQKEIRLTIRVVFYSVDEPHTELMEKFLRYLVRPLPEQGTYEVRLIRPKHVSIFD